MKKPLRRMVHLLVRTGTIKIFFFYLVVVAIGAVLTWIFEPQVNSDFGSASSPPPPSASAISLP